MKRSVTLSAAILIPIVIFLLGCVGSQQPYKETHHYTLEYDPPVVEIDSPFPFPLRIKPFQAAPVYRTSRIVFKSRAFKRDYYHYHKWRADPGELVTWFLTRDLRASGLFKAVFASGNNLQTSYFLEGTVEEFLEQDKSDAWEAVLSFSIILASEQKTEPDGKIIFQKQYAFTEKCKNKNPRAFAEAMSIAMAHLSKAVLSDIKTALSEN